jgi:lipoprotein-releasing system permease protein
MTVLTGDISTPLRVTALVDLGVRELNRRTVYLPLRTHRAWPACPAEPPAWT